MTTTNDEKVGSIEAWEFRNLMAEQRLNRDGWLNRLRNNPADTEAAHKVVELNSNLRLLESIYIQYFHYPEETL